MGSSLKKSQRDFIDNLWYIGFKAPIKVYFAISELPIEPSYIEKYNNTIYFWYVFEKNYISYKTLFSIARIVAGIVSSNEYITPIYTPPSSYSNVYTVKELLSDIKKTSLPEIFYPSKYVSKHKSLKKSRKNAKIYYQSKVYETLSGYAKKLYYNKMLSRQAILSAAIKSWLYF